jgi:hypothetical protein
MARQRCTRQLLEGTKQFEEDLERCSSTFGDAFEEHSEGGSRGTWRGVQEEFDGVFEKDFKECLEKCSRNR